MSDRLITLPRRGEVAGGARRRARRRLGPDIHIAIAALQQARD